MVPTKPRFTALQRQEGLLIAQTKNTNQSLNQYIKLLESLVPFLYC